ncbi:MAG TPA: hypothetical protein GXX41_14130, partial [Thermoanaerobacterium sp.]|nr:hypothetical protein [Thermoanaerobacterium sp.]
NMLDDYNFIRNNIDLMYCDREGVYHCLLMVGEDRPDGILVESEGSSYARYSAFLPNAVDFLTTHAGQEKESAPGMKLKDLMIIPLQGIHLVHSDEDIEIATVGELKSNMLTAAGRKEWADVLNADVRRLSKMIKRRRKQNEKNPYCRR